MNIHTSIKKRMAAAAIAIVVMATGAGAQVYIQSTIPPTGLVQKNQLWNLVLVNGTNAAVDGRLTLVLRDRLQNTELLTATTSKFTLTRGSMPVNINNLSPIQYNYLGINPNALLNGLLPTGNYIACYSFTRSNGEHQEQVSEECVPFDTEPLSPPMLIFPADSSELDAYPTQFTWVPPTPAAMLSNLRYEIFITEVRPGQKAPEAIQENIPFYTTSRITNNFITYPAALPAFEKDKWYSWQVIARDDRNYAGKTETWVFKIKKKTPLTPTVQATPYLKMKPETSDAGIAPDGMLKISFFNRTADSVAQVIVTDLAATGNDRASFAIKIKPGENQAVINVSKKMKLSEESTYKAEITYSTGEHSSVLFRVKNFNNKEGIINQ